MYGNTITKNNGYDANSFSYFPVVILGAGLSGVAMGCRLKEVLGFDRKLFEDKTLPIPISFMRISLSRGNYVSYLLKHP
jgi:hypothetical protein